MKPPPVVALVLSYGLLAATVAATYHLLPDEMATHFDAAGRADAWASPPEYALLLLGSAFFIAALSAGTMYLVRHLPESTLNVPNREYWLAPERRDRTWRRLLDFGAAIGSLTTGLMLGLHILVLRANRTQPARLAAYEVVPLIAGFLVVMGILLYGFSARAWRIEEDDAPRGGRRGG